MTGSSNNGSPAVGSQFSYTFQVKDNGPQGAYGVIFNDSLPASLTLVGITATIGTCGTDTTSGAIRCDVGQLNTGQQSNIVIAARANAAGIITDAASVSMTGPDTQPANNTVSLTIQAK